MDALLNTRIGNALAFAIVAIVLISCTLALLIGLPWMLATIFSTPTCPWLP